jgi:malate dehydrogenase
MAQLATKAGVGVSAVSNVTIWGNHSTTQYPDAKNAKINGQPVFDVISDHDWLRGDMITKVQKRGAEIIAARGSSSAFSAANAAIDHVVSLRGKTPEGHWFSAAIASDGSYGIEEGLLYSYPLTADGQGNWSIVKDIPLDDFAKEKVKISMEELQKEREIVKDLL